MCIPTVCKTFPEPKPTDSMKRLTAYVMIGQAAMEVRKPHKEREK